jgi:hypothetical protein
MDEWVDGWTGWTGGLDGWMGGLHGQIVCMDGWMDGWFKTRNECTLPNAFALIYLIIN